MVPPMTKRPRLERPARVLVGKVFTGGEDPRGAVVWGQLRSQLRASSTTLTFDFDDGRPSIELRRGQVNEGGCLRRTNSKSKNDKHLLRVPLLGGRASYIFSLASAEAQAATWGFLQGGFCMTKWFEAPQQKALDAAEEAERRSFRELNPKAARNAATLIGESGLTADDFWSDGKLRQRRYAQVLSGFESTETRGALPSSQGNVFRMELSRDLLLPRVLGRGPALREAYRELVVQKRQLSEREFWQHYVRAKYRLPIAEDDGAAADGDAAAAGAKGGGGGGGGGRASARPEDEHEHRIMAGAIRAAVRADGEAVLQKELLELDSAPDDGFGLWGIRTRRQLPGWGYGTVGGTVGEPATAAHFDPRRRHRFYLKRKEGEAETNLEKAHRTGELDLKEQDCETAEQGLLRHLNLWADYVLDSRWGRGEQEHEQEGGGREGGAGKAPAPGLALAPLDVYDAEYCYTRSLSSSSPSSSSPTAVEAQEAATETPVAAWRPDSSGRLGGRRGTHVGTPRARALEPVQQATLDTVVSWRRAGETAPRVGGVGGAAVGGAGGSEVERDYKAKLCGAMKKARPFLAHFWAAVADGDTDKAARLHGVLEKLHEELEAMNRGLPAAAKNTLQPLSNHLMHKMLDQAFDHYKRNCAEPS